MKENISRTAGNVYEKMDKDNWMIIPSYKEVLSTSHLNARKLALFPEDKRRPLTEVSDEDIMQVVKENMVNNE
ncbi:MAG: hypothetical protein NC489_38045 [Ruminococcus flavefaciens]|nr:hypothetical protein [Ruminococcus flavefaciens]